MSERSLESAQKIVNRAVELHFWRWDDPEFAKDEQRVQNAANDLVNIAVQQDRENKSVNPGVLEILHVAEIEPVSEPTREAFTQMFGSASVSNGTQSPATAPSPAEPAIASDPSDQPGGGSAFTEATPAGEPAVETTVQADGISLQEIYPGYDDQGIEEIQKAILTFSASGDFTPDEWEQVKAYERVHKNRPEILSLEPTFPSGSQVPAEVEVAPVNPEPVQKKSPVVFAKSGGGAPPADGDSISAFYNGETISRAQQEKLPIPPQTTGESVVMPIDITHTSDQELSRLATAYHSLFARTQWLISQEEGRERAAEQLEHDAHRDAYLSAYENHKSAIPEGKSGPTALDAARKLAEKDADGAHAVLTWRSRKIRHSIDNRELKALSAGYDKAVWRINEELERRARLATTAGAAR